MTTNRPRAVLPHVPVYSLSSSPESPVHIPPVPSDLPLPHLSHRSRWGHLRDNRSRYHRLSAIKSLCNCIQYADCISSVTLNLASLLYQNPVPPPGSTPSHRLSHFAPVIPCPLEHFCRHRQTHCFCYLSEPQCHQ